MFDCALMFIDFNDVDWEKSLEDFSASESDYVPTDLSSPNLPVNYSSSNSEFSVDLFSPVIPLVQDCWEQPSTSRDITTLTNVPVTKGDWDQPTTSNNTTTITNMSITSRENEYLGESVNLMGKDNSNEHNTVQNFIANEVLNKRRSGDKNQPMMDAATKEKNVVEKQGKSIRSRPSHNYKYKIPCTYCSNLEVSNFERHLIRHHKDEKAVLEMMTFPKKSSARRNIISLIRNEGKFSTFLNIENYDVSRLTAGKKIPR